ncbi:MAG: tetratricopeptide repeat protein [Planctomycetota bacterium]|nr:MAG: tetratricopeptide repeat protein [Planctomycetota bacterium]
MKSKAWIVWFAAALIGLVSCSELNRPLAKQESRQRWKDVQGRLKYQLAVENYDLGYFDQAEKYLEESIGLAPTLSDSYILLAKLSLEKGELAYASNALDKALRNGNDSAELYYLNAIIAERYTRYADALSWYRGAAERDPLNAHYIAATAETLVALNRPAEALELVLAKWTDFENNATLRSLAGGIYVMLGRYEEAANAYRAAVQIAPDDVTLKSQLGLALTISEGYQEALPILKSVANDVENVPVSLLTALGRCHLELGEAENAKVVFRRTVEIDNSHPRSWSLLARAALASDDLLTARQATDRAVQLDMNNGEYVLLLGYICWRQQDYLTAVQCLTQVLENNPNELMALYIMADSHRALGDAKAADKCYQRALRVNPQCEWAKRYLNRGSVFKYQYDDGRSMADGGVQSP